MVAALEHPMKLFRSSKPVRNVHILKSYFTPVLFYIS